MKVLHTIASLSRASGGPSRSVTALCNNLGKIVDKVNLLAIGNEEDQAEWVLPNPDVVELYATHGRRIPGLSVRLCPGFGREIGLMNTEGGLSVVHDHGLWLPNNHASAKAAKKLGIPLLVSTRGMLEPWALKYRGWKKRLVWKAWQKADLEGAAVLHATAPEEADNLRALGLKNPIAVIPNGVDLPELGVKERKEMKTEWLEDGCCRT